VEETFVTPFGQTIAKFVYCTCIRRPRMVDTIGISLRCLILEKIYAEISIMLSCFHTIAYRNVTDGKTLSPRQIVHGLLY